MFGRGVLILTVLSSCASSLPVTSSQLENEDVKVMKCIVEALADVLSRPHSVPVSQECLVTLKTDDRLVTILRHHNFLRELQEIAVQGNQERAQLQRAAGSPDPTTQTSESPDAAADRSMLEALGGAGERAILSQKRRTGRVDEEEDKDQAMSDGASQEDNDGAEDAKRGNDEHLGRRVSEAEEWSESKAEKRQEENGESEEKRADSEEDDVTKDKNGAGSEERIGEAQNQSKEKKSHEDDDEELADKRSALSSHKQKKEEREDEREAKGESEKSPKQWSKRGERAQLKKRARAKGAQGVPHHSKEVSDEEQSEEEKKKRDSQRSPEEQELRMIAQRAPEDRRRVSEEEGSASRKPEEPEIESLAAIESELENVAQKLHELRRG